VAPATGSEKIHRSKRDTWLMVVFATAGLFSFAMAVVAILAKPLPVDRLDIRHSLGSLMISPEDKKAFLEDLVARMPGLVLEGDGAVRRG
jgi:hypothetical protein